MVDNKDQQKIETLDAGVLEVRKAFEEVTNRNVRGAVNFSNETRKIVRCLEEKMVHLEKIIQNKDAVIVEMKKQISWLQQQTYK